MQTSDQYRINQYLRDIMRAKRENKPDTVSLRTHSLECYCKINNVPFPAAYVGTTVTEVEKPENKKLMPKEKQPKPEPSPEKGRTCDNCRTPLPLNARTNTKTCSSRCRSALYRQKNSGQ